MTRYGVCLVSGMPTVARSGTIARFQLSTCGNVESSRQARARCFVSRSCARPAATCVHRLWLSEDAVLDYVWNLVGVWGADSRKLRHNRMFSLSTCGNVDSMNITHVKVVLNAKRASQCYRSRYVMPNPVVKFDFECLPGRGSVGALFDDVNWLYKGIVDISLPEPGLERSSSSIFVICVELDIQS